MLADFKICVTFIIHNVNEIVTEYQEEDHVHVTVPLIPQQGTEFHNEDIFDSHTQK